jgi:flagellar biosynthesis/type III secretory pathway protein FliH
VIDEIHQAQELAEAKWAEGLAKGLADGHAKGEIAGQIAAKRDSLLKLLKRAELRLTQAEQERIATCTDLATLDRWFDNALAAETVADVFS